MKKKTLIILLFVSLALIIYPLVTNFYSSFLGLKLLIDYKDELSNINLHHNISNVISLIIITISLATILTINLIFLIKLLQGKIYCDKPKEND